MTEQPDEDQTTTDQTDGTDQGGQGTQGGQDTQGTQGETGEPGEVTDAQLPEDLQPGEDNPLATHPDQTGDEADQIGADREEEPETAPLTPDEADYGSGERSGGSSTGGDGPGDGRVQAEEDDGSDTLDNGGGGAG